MSSLATMRHKFVEFIPDVLEEGTLYISLEYGTIAHQCACGCGEEVVTPLSPTDWSVFFNGKTVSLNPSIGNWSFDCQSHYWILKSEVVWAPQWSHDEIEAGRRMDRFRKERYFAQHDDTSISSPNSSSDDPTARSLWSRCKQFIVGWLK